MLAHRFFIILSIVTCFAACHKKSRFPAKPETPQLPAFFDARPSEKPVSYLYAPGFKATEAAMGRYCPSYTAVTGEKITWKSGGHVIGQPHSAVVFPEIDLRKPTHFTLNPITAIINALRQDLAPLGQRLMQDKLNFTVEDNPESPLSVVNYSLRLSKANLSQKRDIKALHQAYTNHIATYTEHDVILYGDSRGAATIFNFIALHQPTQVKAAVLEGIFDTIPHIIKHFLYTDKKPREEKRLHSLVKFVVGSYKENGMSPRICAEIISDDIPLLIVISLKDELVAPQSGVYLYSRLRQRGHKNVHLLVLKQSKHPSYIISDLDDKKAYEATVHAFYKQYNLPHNSALAELGQASFAATQPTAELLAQTHQLPRCHLCEVRD